MRICFLADAKAIHTYRWIQYFAGKGHEIHLVTFEEFPFKPIENLTVHKITPIVQKKENSYFYPAFLVNTILNPFKVKKLIRKINPDILHAHYLTDYGLLGYLIQFKPFIITLWGSDILIAPKKSIFHRTMAGLILNSANLITCDSIKARDECLVYCKYPEKVKVIQWGVDLSVFREKQTGVTSHPNITILSTRDFYPVYNIDSIIQSISFVAEKYPAVRYILKNFHGNQEPELRQLAESLDVTKNIEFINKAIEYNKLPELLYSSDIFVSVPSSDSSSISLHEAMACGLPVIVSDIPANHEWITDGWNGFIVPVRNPEKLADAIIHMIEKPELMKLFSERNVTIVRDRADQEKHMAHMENLYELLLEKSGRMDKT
jgi:glycosyltransferase involved in cell wall biosynthesis